MKRKQIYLDEKADQRLKMVALRRSCSEALLIREAVDKFLAQEAENAPQPEMNPLLSLIGLAE